MVHGTSILFFLLFHLIFSGTYIYICLDHKLLPGKLIISVLSRIPHTGLDNILICVILRLSEIKAYSSPFASLEMTSLVASGVTSLGENPVPPKKSKCHKISLYRIVQIEERMKLYVNKSLDFLGK